MPIEIGDVTLYSATDIAEMIEAHPSTVRKYLRDGELEGRKIAGKWYVAAGSLVAFLDAPAWKRDIDAMRRRARRLRQRAHALAAKHA